MGEFALGWQRAKIAEATVGCATAVVLGIAVSRFVASPSRSHALLLTALVVPLLVVVIGNVQRCLLALVLFDIPFQWDVLLGYRTDAASIGAIGGLSISVTTIALVVLYGRWLIQLLIRPEEAPRPALRASIPLMLYLAVSGMSVLRAGDQALAAFGLALLLQSFCLYLYVASHVRAAEDVQFMVKVLVAALLAEGVVLLLTRWGYSVPFVKFPIDAAATGFDPLRLGGTVGSPNTAASFLAGLVPPALAVLMTPLGRVWKACAAAALGVGSVGLVLTGSRGGWASVGLSVTLLLFVALRRGWVQGRHVLMGTIALGVVVLPFSTLAADRLTKSDGGAARARLPLDRLALEIVRKQPLLGVGVNNVGLEMQRNAGPEYSEEWVYTVHNRYLLVAAEAGVGALAAFLWFALSTLWRGQLASRTQDRLIAPLAFALTAAVIGQLLHMTVEIFQSRPQVQLFCVFAGLLTAMKDMPCPDE